MTRANYSENKQHDQALIPYVGRLHLDQAPFTADASGPFFYTDPEIKQNLNLLRHLTQSSNLIPVVLSPKDGGKSSLLQAFIEESDSNSKICRIDANHSNDKAYILKEIAKCFDIDSGTSEQELLHLLHKKATALYQDSKYPVIAIENAQHLQDDACKLLLSLQQGLEDKINSWHVLFFADCISGEPPRLYNIDLSRYPQLHILLLEPYTREQTKNYISHRLAAAGHIGDCPLTDDTIHYIHLKSKGLPGKINELAHSALIKLSTQNLEAYPGLKPGFQPDSTNSYLSFRILFFGFLIILVAGIAIYLQEDINALFGLNNQQQKLAAVKTGNGNKPVTEADKAELVINDTSGSASRKPDSQEEDKHNPQEINKATDSMNYSVPAPAEETKSVTISAMDTRKPEEKSAERNLPTHSEPETTSIHTDEIKQEIISAKTAPIINIVQPEKSSISKDPSYSKVQELLPDTVHREDWLLKQQGNYTVRLLGTLKEKIITTYLNENIIGRRLDHEISYYITENDGAYKHTLLYGVFPTYSQAKGAIKSLPNNLKSNGPWPVKLEDIKKSITIYRESKLVNIKKPASAAAPVIKPPQVVTVKVENDDDVSNKNKILQNKDSDSFTVQLLSTGTKKPLLDYIKKYKLGDKSVLYKTTRNDKDWYVLFYGVFKTRKMAEAFVSNLPKNARAGGPWIRKMSDLQEGYQGTSN